MKKYIFLVIAIILALPLAAQHDKRPAHKQQPELTEIVKDLSAIQKRKVETITRDSKERIDTLRKQQQAAHDSIVLFLEREGDQSRTLYPLFDREARLQVAISREMYATKLRIDEVLTKEQRQTLLKHKKERPQRKPVK